MARREPEIELITRIRSGDRLALGPLLLLHHRRLVRHIEIRMTPSAKRAFTPEDIAQQAYTRVDSDIDSFEFRGEGSFFAWLRTIAERQLLNAVKALQTQKRGGGKTALVRYGTDSVRELIDELAANDETPSFRMRRAELLDAFHVALTQLAPDYQEVLRRRFLWGETMEEAAQAMKKTPASIRALTHRAKQQLRKSLLELSLFLSMK